MHNIHCFKQFINVFFVLSPPQAENLVFLHLLVQFFFVKILFKIILKPFCFKNLRPFCGRKKVAKKSCKKNRPLRGKKKVAKKGCKKNRPLRGRIKSCKKNRKSFKKIGASRRKSCKKNQILFFLQQISCKKTLVSKR